MSASSDAFRAGLYAGFREAGVSFENTVGLLAHEKTAQVVMLYEILKGNEKTAGEKVAKRLLGKAISGLGSMFGRGAEKGLGASGAAAAANRLGNQARTMRPQPWQSQVESKPLWDRRTSVSPNPRQSPIYRRPYDLPSNPAGVARARNELGIPTAEEKSLLGMGRNGLTLEQLRGHPEIPGLTNSMGTDALAHRGGAGNPEIMVRQPQGIVPRNAEAFPNDAIPAPAPGAPPVAPPAVPGAAGGPPSIEAPPAWAEGLGGRPGASAPPGMPPAAAGAPPLAGAPPDLAATTGSPALNFVGPHEIEAPPGWGAGPSAGGAGPGGGAPPPSPLAGAPPAAAAAAARRALKKGGPRAAAKGDPPGAEGEGTPWGETIGGYAQRGLWGHGGLTEGLGSRLGAGLQNFGRGAEEAAGKPTWTSRGAKWLGDTSAAHPRMAGTVAGLGGLGLGYEAYKHLFGGGQPQQPQMSPEELEGLKQWHYMQYANRLSGNPYAQDAF